jgi:hypothetical protein
VNGPTSEITTAEAAIREQLDTAISLWFREAPLTPIGTLAYAALRRAHDLAVTLKQGKPSEIIVGILKLPKKQRDKIMLPINFAKHGDREMKDIDWIKNPPLLAEHLMYEAAICYANLFDDLTPLMRLFVARFTLDEGAENFSGVELPSLEKLLASQKDFAGLSRGEFAEKVLPLLSKWGRGRPL